MGVPHSSIEQNAAGLTDGHRRAPAMLSNTADITETLECY